MSWIRHRSLPGRPPAFANATEPDVDTSVAVLEKLRARGFGLSIDDFGTGYSSLGYLRSLPVHELNNDRTFVMKVARGGPDAVLAKTMIILGASLDCGL